MVAHVSDDNVVTFDGITKLPIDPSQVCNEAARLPLDEVVVIGWQKGELYFAASEAEPKAVLWLIELAKLQLLTQEVATEYES
jgi:hypothetical protein